MKRAIIGIILCIFLIGITGIIAAEEDNQTVGGQKDSHGCLGPAGYSWNETEQKCVREWENGTGRYQDIKKEIKQDIRDLRRDVNELIKEKKGEYKFKGEGKNITVRAVSDDKKEILIEKINARTGLNLTSEDLNNETALGAWLSNGRHAIIKIMPDRASERAIERLKLRVCNESNNCSIELKEVGIGNKTKLAYEISAEENSRVLFLFKNRMKVVAQVDGETGEIISVKKPWWSFLAKKSN